MPAHPSSSPQPGLMRVFADMGRWPLAVLHALGWVLGWLAWLASATYRRRWRDNVALAALTRRQALASIGAAGQMVMEIPRLWFGPAVPVRWEGLQHIEHAHAHGRSVLFLTPHLGAFELTVLAHAQRFARQRAITVLFRPPPKAALAPLLAAARNREGISAVATSLGGVRQLMQTLAKSGTVGLLPDQVPIKGLGVWAPFFGRPAYTMTLAARLAALADVVLLAWAQRLPRARGYVIHVLPAPAPLSGDKQAAAAQINAWMEDLIRQQPEQYLWGYHRYKSPHD